MGGIVHWHPEPDDHGHRGALDHGFQHGVFFTTSTFTLKAEEEARRAGQVPIKLIGLALLIKMLKDKQLGLIQQPDQTYQIHHPYFEKFKSTGTSGWTGKTLFTKTPPSNTWHTDEA